MMVWRFGGRSSMGWREEIDEGEKDEEKGVLKRVFAKRGEGDDGN